MPKTETKLKKQNYFVGEVQLGILQEISHSTGLSVAEHVRRAMDLYIVHYRSQQAKGMAQTIGPIVSQ